MLNKGLFTESGPPALELKEKDRAIPYRLIIKVVRYSFKILEFLGIL